jgi:TonB family protein
MAEITIRVSDKALRIIGFLLCGAILLWFLFSLLSSGFFLPKYQLSLYVPEVAGLGVHASVRLDGVEIGSVTAIRLAGETANPERRIELVLRVEKAYQNSILSDSKATLASEGLLGNRYVNITRGLDGTVIKPGAEIPFMPSEVLTLKDSLDLLGKTVDCINRATDSGDGKTQGGATKQVCQSVSANPPGFNPFQFIPKVADFPRLNLRPKVSFVVNEHGSVSKVKVLTGTGSPEVDAGLVKSIQAWKYKPQTGCTIETSLSVVIDIGQP